MISNRKQPKTPRETTMAKREISGTLRNLKFMQRATLKVEEKKSDEEPNENSSSLRKKCVVITDCDPQPGAFVGRMSFQSFNPYNEKLNEEALNGQRTVGSTKSCSSNEGKISFSQNASCLDEPECPKGKAEPSQESSGNMKRRQSEEVVSEQHYPNKFRRNGKGNAFKHQKGKKVDWSVLMPSKPQTQTG